MFLRCALLLVILTNDLTSIDASQVGTLSQSSHLHHQTQISASVRSAIDAANRKTQLFSRWATEDEDGRFDAHNPLEFLRVDKLRVKLEQHVNMHVNATVLENSGQWVEVCWEGVRMPAADDYIALYVPADADFARSSPVKYQWAALDPAHLLSGAGCLRFRLINMRADMRFVLMRGGLDLPTVSAHSEAISFRNRNQPTNGHLALTGREGEMLVQWSSADTTAPEVRWGTAAAALGRSTAAMSSSYGRADMCGPPANGAGWMEPGLLHRAVLPDLEPDTEYFYYYGDEAGGWSTVSSFVSPPLTGPASSVSFFAIADMGQAELDGSNENGFGEESPSLNTSRLMAAAADGRRLVVHNGDISYARGYGSQWDVFGEQIESLARRMPWMTVEGNHERDWPFSADRYGSVLDSGGECGVAHEERFHMPLPGRGKFWYSFNFGPVHFLQYSTEQPFSRDSEQYRFLAADLAAVNRSATPWLVVGGHRPFYIDSTNAAPVWGDLTVAADLRESLEDLFYHHQVDMTWHGHHHSYQRTCPVHRGVCKGYADDGSAAAPVHLVIGHAGAGLCWNVSPHRPSIFDVIMVEWGFMKVDANATHMSMEMIADADGSVKDRFTLTKPAGWRPNPPEVRQTWRQWMRLLFDRAVWEA